jgi:hypothetical protein
MKFYNYLNEVITGKDSWEKYFKGKEVKTIIKKTAIVYDNDLNKTDDVLEIGEEVIVPESSRIEFKGKSALIKVLYKGKPVNIVLNTLKKPTTKGGEQLSIPASKLVQVAQGKTVTVKEKTFPAKVFYSSIDLSNTIQNGIKIIKTIPDDLKDILIRYLNQNQYKYIDWQGYDNKQFINEIAKYLGELIIGLCVMNGDNVLTGSNPFKGKKIKEFIVPTDSSFAGVDSMFKTKKGESIAISSKLGKGAPASFHANVIPELVKTNPRSKILKYMVDIMKQHNYKNLEFLYDIGINYIMGKYLKGKPGQEIKNNPYMIYNNLKNNKITEKEEYILDIVKNPKIKWPVMKNHKTIINKLPDSFTYFICQNIAEIINQDKTAINEIVSVLNAKNFFQANLNQSKFKNGEIEFKMIESGSDKLKVLQGKGSMGSVKSEQGRLSYMIG